MLKPENIRISKIYGKTNAHEAKHLEQHLVFYANHNEQLDNSNDFKIATFRGIDKETGNFNVAGYIYPYIAELEYVPDEPIWSDESIAKSCAIPAIKCLEEQIAELTQYKTWAEIELKRWHEQHEQLQGLHKWLYDENEELKEKLDNLKLSNKALAESVAQHVKDKLDGRSLFDVIGQTEPEIYFFGNIEQGARKYEGQEMEFLDFEGNWKKEILIKICSSSELKNIGIEDETCVFQVKDLRPLGVSVYQFMRPIKADLYIMKPYTTVDFSTGSPVETSVKAVDYAPQETAKNILENVDLVKEVDNLRGQLEVLEKRTDRVIANLTELVLNDQKRIEALEKKKYGIIYDQEWVDGHIKNVARVVELLEKK